MKTKYSEMNHNYFLI